MDIGEGIVKIQQVLVERAVAHDGGGEGLPAVGGVKEGEGQPTLAYIPLYIVDVVKF